MMNDYKIGTTLRQVQSLQLKQNLTLTTQQIITSQILALPLPFVDDFIASYAEENVFLQPSDGENKVESEKLRKEDIEELLRTIDRTKRDGSFYTSSEDKEEFDFLSNINLEMTLQEHLLQQLELAVDDKRKKEIGIWIITSMDSAGYILDKKIEKIISYTDLVQGKNKQVKNRIDANPWQELKEVLGSPEESGISPPVTPEEIEEVLKIIQSFDPPGVGARSLKESLLIQLNQMDDKPRVDGAKVILEQFSEEELSFLIEKKEYDRIASVAGISHNEVEKSLDVLRKLNPYPGSSFRSISVRSTVSGMDRNIIVPIAEVKKVEYSKVVHGEKKKYVDLDITYFAKYGRKVRVNEKLWKEIKKNWDNIPEEKKDHIKELYGRAQSLLKMAGYAESILERVTEAIVEAQKEFFLTGDKLKMVSLTLNDVASRVEADTSVVSRAIKDKYLATPYGLMSYKEFFPRGLKKTGMAYEEKVLVNKVLEVIKELINNEAPSSPLSDDQIATILQKRGYQIARRTVAKYRQQLGIPSSSKRRRR